VSQALLSDIEVAKDAECLAPQDLFERSARDVIGRAGANFLQSIKLTPIELLHSPNAQRAMMDSGTNAMQAVQKIASWQVRGTSTPVTERVRAIWAIVDNYRAFAAARVEQDPPISVTRETLPDILAWRDEESGEDRAFRIYACLAKTLEGSRSWSRKTEILVGLMAGVVGMDAAGYFDALIAEILRPPKALAEILGEEEYAGDQVAVLLSLADGTIDPRTAPSDIPVAEVLYELLARAKTGLPEIRSVLMAHAVRIVQGNRSLTNKPPMEEIGLIVSIRERLTRHGEIVGGEDTEEALQRRLSRSISDQTIDQIMVGTKSIAERVLRAAQLHVKIVGAKPQAYLESYISELMAQDNVDAKLLPENRTVNEKIRLLGKLHRVIVSSEIAEKTRERIASQVERAQTTLLERANFFETLLNGPGGPAERLDRLLDLAIEGAFTQGANLAAARRTAQALMKKPDFFQTYLAGIEDRAEQATRLRDLEKKLAEGRVV